MVKMSDRSQDTCVFGTLLANISECWLKERPGRYKIEAIYGLPTLDRYLNTVSNIHLVFNQCSN